MGNKNRVTDSDIGAKNRQGKNEQATICPASEKALFFYVTNVMAFQG